MEYSQEFYKRLRGGASESARRIVPWLLDLLHPESVVDVGCGTGAWLAVFGECGVRDLLGIDGHFNEKLLDVSSRRYLVHDLEKPIQLQRRFELVVSLEVAEHLPMESAEVFVRSLASLGDVVVFSAAVPGQGGTHHVNEQWPDYWIKCFEEIGYRAVDCFRSRFWTDEGIDWWYRQNLFLFVAESRLRRDPEFEQRLAGVEIPLPTRVVHPAMYRNLSEVMRYPQKITEMEQVLALHVPMSTKLVLIDEGKLGGALSGWKHVWPFPEKNGEYNGKPAGSADAIRELERLRSLGAEFAAVTDDAFWWLDHYEAFGAHLADMYDRCFRNEDLMIFDLRRD